MKPTVNDIAALRVLSEAHRKKQTALKRELANNTRVRQLVSDCCHNFLRGNLRVKNPKRFKPHAKAIRALAAKNTSVAKKKQLIQKGGTLSVATQIICRCLNMYQAK